MSEEEKKKFKRKLTPFLCQEMLYDYAIGNLDPERRAAVDDFMKNDQDSRRMLEAIHRGLEYAGILGRTELDGAVLAQLREAENAISLGRRYSTWKEWPEVFRWSVTAVGVSALVAALIVVIPWSRFPSLKSKPSDSFELAEIQHPGDKQIEALNDHQEADPGDQGSGDDEIEAPDSPEVAAAKAKLAGGDLANHAGSGDDEAAENEEAGPAAPTLKPAVPKTPVAPPKTPMVVAKNGVAAPTAEKSQTDEEASSGSQKESKAKGFVFRARMNLSNLDEIGPKITENITELGGEKAGEVELGWKRGTGRYYHFEIPEENQEKLLEKLRAYGPVRISKDPHPRVMPEGQIRFILWVESH